LRVSALLEVNGIGATLGVKQHRKITYFNEHTLIAFPDIGGAFNDVLPIAITESVTVLGVEPKMVGLIHKLMIRRMVTTTLETSTQTRLVNRD